jgi:GNAT superfamily N-acetyltransferase
MKDIIIQQAVKADGKEFLSLIDALAHFEKLKNPTRDAKKRLFHDAFGKHKRFDVFLAFVAGKVVGYAIIFETYSSFLALPTLYLEDIFVLPDYRKHRVGLELFRRCLVEAQRRGCGRMEWMVLDWNVNARRFYDKLGACQLKQWLPYRLERKQFRSLLQK